MARSLWANGLRKNDIMQNAYGYGLFTGAHGFEKGAQKIGAMVITIASGNTERQIDVMRDFGATALACTPSYSLHIAEVAEEKGFNPAKDFKLRSRMHLVLNRGVKKCEKILRNVGESSHMNIMD